MILPWDHKTLIFYSPAPLVASIEKITKTLEDKGKYKRT